MIFDDSSEATGAQEIDSGKFLAIIDPLGFSPLTFSYPLTLPRMPVFMVTFLVVHSAFPDNTSERKMGTGPSGMVKEGIEVTRSKNYIPISNVFWM